MGVPRYTTPTFTLTFTEPGVNFLQATNIYVTFKNRQKNYVLTKSGEDLDFSEKTISIRLEQEETAKFKDCVLIQANWTVGQDRIASDVVAYEIDPQLLERVVE